MLRKNFRYKMLALTAALVLWAYANLGQNPNVTREIKVPLDVSDIQDGYLITDAPETVRILLQGQRTHVESIVEDPESVSAVVRLRGKKAGHYMLPLKVQIPDGLTVLVKAVPIPREVGVTIAEKVDRSLPVDVQFLGPPPVGLRFGSPKLTPDRATFSGSSETVNSVEQLVASVDAKGAASGVIDTTSSLAPLDKNGKRVAGLELAPAKVHVHLQLLDAPASRIVFVSPSVVGQPQYPNEVTKIEVSPQTISVTGSADQLGGVTTIRTEPISVDGRTAGFTQRVRVVAPKGLTIGDNGMVRITVTIKAVAAKGP